MLITVMIPNFWRDKSVQTLSSRSDCSWKVLTVRWIRYLSHVTRKAVFCFQPGKTQTGLLSHRSQRESWNCKYRNKRYYTIWAVNNKDADQLAQMRRLICSFVVCIWHKHVFSWCGSFMIFSQDSLDGMEEEEEEEEEADTSSIQSDDEGRL